MTESNCVEHTGEADTRSARNLAVRESADPSGWIEFLRERGYDGFQRDPRWLDVLKGGLGHRPLPLEAVRAGRVVGVLPLSLVKSVLFGRFLVALPYVNSGGVLAEDDDVGRALVHRAVELAGELDVRHLELRHEGPLDHESLTGRLETKVHSRLALAATSGEQWDALRSKVRSQVRKGLANAFDVRWGGVELLDDFYRVFCRNSRDLGSPPFPRELFRRILVEFRDEAELCCLRFEGRTVAAALLVHGPGTTQVPSAGTLRKVNPLNANMVLYWRLLERAIERGQRTFDFGRSTRDGGTHRFKRQWGAEDVPAVWQYHVRRGDPTGMRRESGGFDLAVRVWKRLPVWVTRVVGPVIVRGIP